MRSIRPIVDEAGKPVVIVLHDINQAAAHADRIVAMKAGRIVADGTPKSILDTLQNIFGFEMRVDIIDDIPVALHFR